MNLRQFYFYLQQCFGNFCDKIAQTLQSNHVHINHFKSEIQNLFTKQICGTNRRSDERVELDLLPSFLRLNFKQPAPDPHYLSSSFDDPPLIFNFRLSNERSGNCKKIREMNKHWANKGELFIIKTFG